LNERHYGALQGLNKKEMAEKYGEKQVHIWRRSYDVPPPKDKSPLNPEGISESLKDTAARTLPYYRSRILPLVKAGKKRVGRRAREFSALHRYGFRAYDQRAGPGAQYPDRSSHYLRDRCGGTRRVA